MPFRIRARAGGELEVEVDTPLEVQALLQVVLPGSPQARPFLALPPGPAVIAAAPAAVPRRKYKRRGAAQRRSVDRVARRPREAPPASSAPAVGSDALVRLLERGSLSSGDLAGKVGWLRPRVTKALKELAAQGRVHATGRRAGTRYHAGPAPAAQAAAPRRSL